MGSSRQERAARGGGRGPAVGGGLSPRSSVPCIAAPWPRGALLLPAFSDEQKLWVPGRGSRGSPPPPDPSPCPPAGSGTSLFPCRPFQHAPPRPVLPACEWQAAGALPARAAGATVRGAGRWPSGSVAGSPGQGASLLMVASLSEEFQNGGSSACLPIVRHGYALPYFSPGSDSPF